MIDPSVAASLPSNCHVAQRLATRQLGLWLLVVMLLGFVALVSRLNEVTHDAFHEMALFREYLASGQFPVTDCFAYTDTVRPSVHHEWGTGAVLYLATTASGLGLFGFSILKFALMGLLWCMLYRVARLRGAHPYLFATISLAVFPVLWVGFATIRATLFTLVFLSIQLWMQEQDRRGHRWWILAWAIMLVAWLNMHAGFVVGVGLLGLYTVERTVTLWLSNRDWYATLRATWHLALWPVLAALAVLINPYGPDYVPYLIRAISMPRPLIAEWGPLWNTHDPVVTLIMFGLSLALIAISLRAQPVRNWIGAVGLLVCGAMALAHLRHGSIYAVVWIAYVPAWLSGISLGREIVQKLKQHHRFCTIFARTVAIGCLVWSGFYAAWQTTLSGDSRKQTTCYPIESLEFLRERQFQGNLLTPFHAGAYVSWRMHPHVKVSLDGRYEVAYAPNVFEEHWAFFEGESNWRDLLERYPHDAILVNQSAKVRPLLEIFRSPDAPWQFVHEDANYLVLTRNTNQSAMVTSTSEDELQ